MKRALITIAALPLLAACGASHPHHAAASAVAAASPAPSPPARCAAIMRAVSDVAGKAGIDLGTGSMSARNLTLNKELGWGTELRKASQPVSSPTAADVKLQEDVLTASLRAVMSSNADGRKFIAGLQKIRADCS